MEIVAVGLANSPCIPLLPDPFWSQERPKSQMHKNNHQDEKLVLLQRGMNSTIQIHDLYAIICYFQLDSCVFL